MSGPPSTIVPTVRPQARKILCVGAVTIYKVSAAGQQTTVAAVPHVANTLSVSRDLKRATIGWIDYHGDAWMYRVVRP